MQNHKRHIRSFMLRQGRVSERQELGLQRYWLQYGLTTQSGRLDYAAIFKRQADIVLEIGFGMGHSLVACAKNNPNVDYIGVEVHRPGVGALLAEMGEQGVNNIRVFQEDVKDVLMQSIPDNFLSGIQIFFPDPWPKRRHHKRRLIQAEFVDLLWHKLKTGAFVHMATDWEDYAQHMMQVFTQYSGFNNLVGSGNYLTEDHVSRLHTKFELRGKRLGHGVWDMMFIKIT